MAVGPPQMALKAEELKHAHTYHPQFLDNATSSGHAFHFDTLLTYTSGQSNENNNNNCNVNDTDT